jgi:hypothetical protein
MPQYTLFRHKTRPELRCAVPAHDGLPKTLQDGTWEQDPDVFDAGSAPAGFEENAARYAIAVQGFYVFGQRTRAQAYTRRAAAAYTV